MLERTGGCLESGNLRRLLPASKDFMKSRRTLHSGFWTHAAGDLELSPLWAVLVRTAEPAESRGEFDLQRKNSTAGGGMLLDFLYPTGTLNFIRQYSGWGVDRQDNRRLNGGLGKIGQRQYTSSAIDVSPTGSTAENARVTGFEAGSDNSSEGLKRLYELIRLERSSDYEEAWRQFGLLDSLAQRKIRRPLIVYLSASQRVIDSERTIELFNTMENKEKDVMVYRSTVRSYLKLRNLSDAMRLYRLAVENLAVPAGVEQILAYLIENSSWSRACSLFEDFENLQLRAGNLDGYKIFEAIDTLPNLPAQALELVAHVNSRIETANADAPVHNLITFGSRIVRRALLKAVSFSPARFMGLMQALQNWGIDIPAVYHDAIQLLYDKGETKLAVKCYREARRRPTAIFTRPTLHIVLSMFCQHHSVLGMQQVLDDFFRLYSKPTRKAYKMCMVEFAAQGDARTVHALFDQYSARFFPAPKGTLIDGDDFAPLLTVHAKRGELPEVLNAFNRIKEEFGFKPTIMCWNILLSAYAKVQDTDSAFECFHKLLNSAKLKPDHYTFGTMMGLCATRGDTFRLVELYALAEDLGIQKSSSMIDTLVQAYSQDGDLQRAEQICEDAIEMKLTGSRTRMWNYLLVTYALQRDLNEVNRLLQRMSDLDIDYDQYTYAALMQSLAMVKQPDKAYAILKDVMPEARIKATPLHYAIVMGGYIANGEVGKVHGVHRRLVRRMQPSASTNLMVLKATVIEDQKLQDQGGSDEQILQRSFKIFQEILSGMDPQDISNTARKGFARLPLDVAYSSMFFSFIIFVLAQRKQTVDGLYEEFKLMLPASRRDNPPIQILSALMISKYNERDYEGVQKCWDLAYTQAKKQAQPLPTIPRPNRKSGKEASMGQAGTTQQATFTLPDDVLNPSDKSSPGLASEAIKVESNPPDSVTALLNTTGQDQPLTKPLHIHQLDLNDILMTYMRSLSRQERTDDLIKVMTDLQTDGFVLSNKNWNVYLQILARKHKYKLAFELCESYLMDGFTGWARLRWQLPVRNRLPLELRNWRKQPRNLRPMYITLLYLARGYLDLNSSAAESRASQLLISNLQRDCPRTVRAIQMMQRTDDDVERTVLRDL